MNPMGNRAGAGCGAGESMATMICGGVAAVRGFRDRDRTRLRHAFAPMRGRGSGLMATLGEQPDGLDSIVNARRDHVDVGVRKAPTAICDRGIVCAALVDVLAHRIFQNAVFRKQARIAGAGGLIRGFVRVADDSLRAAVGGRNGVSRE